MEETVYINNILPKWISEFDISDEEVEPLHFLLFKDYLNYFKRNKNNHINDEQNRIIIDGRVEEKCAELQYELDETKEEVGDLTNKIHSLSSKCNDLHSENDSLKNSRQVAIDNAVNDLKEAQAGWIQQLQNEIQYLKTEILSKFNEDTNKSPYETGEIGQDEMLAILQEGSWDEVIDCHGKDHSGDFLVKYIGKTNIIDVKNYTYNVPAKEVRKIAKDIETTSCDGGVIISLNSGILDPNTNCTKKTIDQIIVSGKSVLLFPNSCRHSPEAINTLIKSFFDHNVSCGDNSNSINKEIKKEIVKTINKMEAEIVSEERSYNRAKIKKINDLEHLKNTLKEIIGDFDELLDDDSPKPQISDWMKKAGHM